MPNFGLVINSTYNPMSFEQYAAPFEKYASVYKEMADTYDALEMEANQWEKLANEQDKSSNAYKTYQKYAADIRAAANDLVDNGLSTKTRSSIMGLKRRYASEIKPIEELYNYRNKLAEEQRKLNPKGDMQWDVDFSNIGLDALAANPTMTYKGRSLAEVEKAGEDIARAASSRRYLSEAAQDMANQYYRVSQGFDGGDVADFLAKNVNSPAFQELMGLYEQVRTTYGTNNPESIYSKDQNTIADERILTGMLKGLAYKEDYQTNYKEKATNTKSGSGSGDDIITQYVGYETTIINDKGVPQTYTTVNEEGKIKYYDSDNKEVTDEKIIETLNKSKSEGRYYLQPHNNNADLVTVMDKETSMPLIQNGKYMEFNRKTHYLDVKTFEIKPIVKPKTKTTKIPSGVVVVSNTKGKNAEVDWDDFTQDDIDALLKDLSKGVTYDNLKSDEKNVLPEEVKANPASYMYYRVTIDAKKGPRYGDNNVLFYKYVGQINQNDGSVSSDASSDFDNNGIR